MVDLADFLLARITEDEAVDPEWGFLTHVVLHRVDCLEFGAVERSDAECDCDGPARWLAECAAKRRIIEEAFRFAAQIDGEWGCCHSAETIRAGFEDDDGERIALDAGYCCGPETAARLLKPLASVYADHPDYDEAWRP